MKLTTMATASIMQLLIISGTGQALITKGDVSRVEITEPVIRNPVMNVPGGYEQPRVERILCALPAAGHTLWMPGLATDIINDFGDLKLIEFSSGDAVMAGQVYRRSQPAASYDVFLRFGERQGEIDSNHWYFYESVSGFLRSFPDGQDVSVQLSRRGGPLQIGYWANKKNGAYGAASWFNYWGTHDGQGDLNIKLVSCDQEPEPEPEKPSLPEWVDYEVVAANGSACPAGDVSIASSANRNRIDINIPMINLETDRLAREFCQATIQVNRPEGWKFAVKKYDAWYEVDLSKDAEATITGSSYFQASPETTSFVTALSGPVKKQADIHQQVDDEDLVFSDCDGSRAVNLKTAALVRKAWGSLTIKPKQRFQIVWKACD